MCTNLIDMLSQFETCFKIIILSSSVTSYKICDTPVSYCMLYECLVLVLKMYLLLLVMK